MKTHPYGDYHEGDGWVREKLGDWGARWVGGGGKVGKCRTESAYLFGYIAVLGPFQILALFSSMLHAFRFAQKF